MNLKTQYSIIGGSAGAFILVLIILFLPQTPDEQVPITPVAEQIISNQTNDGGTNEVDDTESILEELSLPSVEPVVGESTVVISEPDLQSSNVRSSRPGGGGGGGSSNGNDNDNNEDSRYHLQLFEGEQESDGTIDLGQNIRAIASTDDKSVDEVIFRWIDPSNNIVETEIVPIELESSEASFQPDILGTWIVEADFGNGEVVVETIEMSFLVIPESPFGMAALMASSLAALGAFMFLRMRSSTETTDLGT